MKLKDARIAVRAVITILSRAIFSLALVLGAPAAPEPAPKAAVSSEAIESAIQEIRKRLQGPLVLPRTPADLNIQSLTLAELDFASRQLADSSVQYVRFLDEHLLWIPSAEDHAVALLRHHLAWLMAVRIPLLFVCAMIAAQDHAAYGDSLGRIAFMGAMAAVAVFAERILRPDQGALASWLRQHPRGWLSRLRYISGIRGP